MWYVYKNNEFVLSETNKGEIKINKSKIILNQIYMPALFGIESFVSEELQTLGYSNLRLKFLMLKYA